MAIVILGGLTTSPRLNLLMLLVLALRFGKCLLCSPANLPFLASRTTRKKCEKAYCALKVVWILRNIVCDRQQRTRDRKTGKGVSLTTS
jgi:hypothetical protein